MDIPSSLTPPIDLTRLFSLDAGKQASADPAKVAMLAQEFEAMLLLQMVRQMRQSMLLEDEQDSGLGNETMTDTFDVEFARYLSKAGGIGLGQMINRHLTEASATATKATAASHPPLLLAGADQGGEGGRGGEEDSSSLAPLALPLAASAATSAFGWRTDPFRGHRKFHNGVDLRAAYGTEVPAASAGRVTFSGERGGYGLMVVVQHDNGLETRYAHLASTTVQAGQTLDAGQVIGRVGSSGRSTAPHLHFEVLLDGERVDPEQMAVKVRSSL